MISIRLFASFLLILQYGSFNAQQSIEEEILKIVGDESAQNTIYGVSVIDVDGLVRVSMNDKSLFMPASTMKVITTFTGLGQLGDDFRFTTSLYSKGELTDDGTLHGDLIIRGSGDPSLGSPGYPSAQALDQVMFSFIEFVEEAGIKCVTGELIIDIASFEKRFIHPSWSWDDLTNYYASGSTSVNIHENFYYIDFNRSNLPDQSTSISTVRPKVPALTIDNFVKTGPLKSGDNAYIYGSPYDESRWIEGTIPPGQGNFTIKGAVPDPVAFFGSLFVEYLRKRNINIGGYQKSTEIEYSNHIGTIYSDPLIDLAQFANYKSNNLFCEAIYNMLGLKFEGIASFSSGAAAVTNYLEKYELPSSQITSSDGSGLSWRNRISPKMLSSFLFHESKIGGIDRIKHLLPQAGSEGSVRNFMKGSLVANRLWLKSGSINNVQCYTGLLQAKSGAYFLITLMANGHRSNSRMRSIHADVINVLYSHL